MGLVRITDLQEERSEILMSTSDQPSIPQCSCWFQAQRGSDVQSRVSPFLTDVMVSYPIANTFKCSA